MKATAAVRVRRWREANLDRANEIQRESYHRTKNEPHNVAARDRTRLAVYGLTPDDLERMIASQGNRCGICDSPHRGRGKRLHVDHDHATGKVRGLLCGPCNSLLGHAGDDIERLRSAIRYLQKHT